MRFFFLCKNHGSSAGWRLEKFSCSQTNACPTSFSAAAALCLPGARALGSRQDFLLLKRPTSKSHPQLFLVCFKKTKQDLKVKGIPDDRDKDRILMNFPFLCLGIVIVGFLLHQSLLDDLNTPILRGP